MFRTVINGSCFNLKGYYKVIHCQLTETKLTLTAMKHPLLVRKFLNYQHKPKRIKDLYKHI